MAIIEHPASSLAPATASPQPLNRRAWLKQLVAAALIFPVGRAGSQPLQAIAGGSPPRWREFLFSELGSWQTPTAQFFLRSHLDHPQLSVADWKLTLDGLVKQRSEFSFEELIKLPSVTRTVTFECSGNPPGGGLISTAEWRAIPLHLLLEKAGVGAGAKEIVFEGADFGLDEEESVPLIFSRSIPLQKALSTETMLAWEMNGKPLSWEHGFPVRVVVPGYYAMSHVKWLSRIRVIDHSYKGFYMTKRYFTARRIPGTGRFEFRAEMQMKIKSQIARPVSGEQISGASTIVTGAAWSGEGIVKRVEVSTDGGSTWTAAVLLDKPVRYAWVRWRLVWNTPANGVYTLVCRAFDDAGGAQPEEPDNSVINRYGNNWYHRVEIKVLRT
ncbi:MAG TPA: sulfite oxidase [Acidobacteriota bacterium]|jgi:DMSO/TMAO reductase YedYZ molybdopterin-dependent catalytic subunit